MINFRAGVGMYETIRPNSAGRDGGKIVCPGRRRISLFKTTSISPKISDERALNHFFSNEWQSSNHWFGFLMTRLFILFFKKNHYGI